MKIVITIAGSENVILVQNKRFTPKINDIH